MLTQHTEFQGPATHGSDTLRSAAQACRAAWWSLALFPVTLAGAFVIGEGLLSALTDDAGDAASWQVLGAATPALLFFVLPGILAVALGGKAVRLGRTDGKVPAALGATIAVGFVLLNAAAYLVGALGG